MKVVLNAAILQRGISGTANVTNMLASALAKHPDIELILVQPLSPPGESRLANAAKAASWDLLGAARAVPNYDRLISPCNIGRGKPSKPHLLVVQDTMVLDHPSLFDRGYVQYARLLFTISVRSASRILTASEYSASRIRARWSDAPPIDVIHWPISGPLSAALRMNFESPFKVLMVGATEPHKNHVVGIDAVRLSRLITGVPIELTLVGPEGRAETAVREMARLVDPASEWIKRIVNASQDELEVLYQESSLLLQPSLDEGFGLPLLEAARHLLPVVHSGAGSMAEVHPDGNAGGTDAIRLSRRICVLLEPHNYRRGSEASQQVALRHSFDDFAERLTDLVMRV